MSAIPQREANRQSLLKLIWLYFILLLFEGALRKWVVPFLSDPLLIIRDPVALLIYVQALRLGFVGSTGRYVGWAVMAFGFLGLGLLQAVLQGIRPEVVIYGWRTYFFHVPLIFIIPEVVRPSDVMKMGKLLLLMSVPMALLMLAQFRAPSDSFINASTIEGGAQITLVGDKIRPPGIFSFTSGASTYFSIVFALLLYGSLAKKIFNPATMVVASFSLVAGAFVSGSRTYVVTCGMIMILCLPVLVRFPAMLLRLVGAAVALGLGVIVMLALPATREAFDIFAIRWTGAAETEQGAYVGGWLGRVFAGPMEAFYWGGETPLTGFGMGLGTNVGAKLMTGSAAMIAPEWEWARMVFELGPFFGFIIIFARCAFAFLLMRWAWQGVVKGRFLAWILMTTVVYNVTSAQLKQPTMLGFTVFFAGLALAAMSDEAPSRPPIAGDRQNGRRFGPIRKGSGGGKPPPFNGRRPLPGRP